MNGLITLISSSHQSITEATIKKLLPEDIYKLLIEKKVLVPSQPLGAIWCTNCEKHSTLIKEKKNGDYQGICEEDGYYNIPREQITTFDFIIENFLDFLSKELKTTGELFKEESYWRLGYKHSIEICFASHLHETLFNKIKEGDCLFITPLNKKIENTISLIDFLSYENDILSFNTVTLDWKIQSIIANRNTEKPLQEEPYCSYAGIEIYCEENLPYRVKYAKIKGSFVVNGQQNMRQCDLEVLKILVERKGETVPNPKLGEVIMGETYDELSTSHADIDRSISRLNKIEGIIIKSRKGIGRYLKK